MNNPDRNKVKIKPHLHKLSPECIEEIAVFIEGITTDEMDCDTRLIIQEILNYEIEDEVFLNFTIELKIRRDTFLYCQREFEYQYTSRYYW